VLEPWNFALLESFELDPARVLKRGLSVSGKLNMELGEYARDQGFWLPNPVSMH